MEILSQIGLILLMLQIGLEFDFSHLVEHCHRAAVIRVAAASLILPFVLGLGFGSSRHPTLSPQADPTASALFIATLFPSPPCRSRADSNGVQDDPNAVGGHRHQCRRHQ